MIHPGLRSSLAHQRGLHNRQMHQRREHAEPRSDEPRHRIAASRVKQIPAHPGAQKAADLMAKEHHAGEHR